MSWPTTMASAPRHGDEGGAEQFGEGLVPLVRHHSADVVRLHDLRQISSHDPPSLTASPMPLAGAGRAPKLPAAAGTQDMARAAGRMTAPTRPNRRWG